MVLSFGSFVSSLNDVWWFWQISLGMDDGALVKL